MTDTVTPGTCDHVTGLRAQFVHTMACYFEVVGARDLRARVPGKLGTLLVKGQTSDQRPDLSLVQILPSGRALVTLVDTIPPAQMREPAAIAQRLTLFNHYILSVYGELHVTVASYTTGSPPTQARKIRDIAADLGVVLHKVWEL